MASKRVQSLLLKLAKRELWECEQSVDGYESQVNKYVHGYEYSKTQHGTQRAHDIWYSDVRRSRRELKKAQKEARAARALVRELSGQ